MRNWRSFKDSLVPRFSRILLLALMLNLVGFSARAQTATGGTTNDITIGTDAYRVHTFISDGTLNISGSIEFVEYLVVGGGGGGGKNLADNNRGAGGGGGGQVNSGSLSNVTAQSVVVSIGLGGAGGTGVVESTIAGQNGGASTVNISPIAITAIGGGGGGGAGGSPSSDNGLSGASGGGGGNSFGLGAVGTAGFSGGDQVGQQSLGGSGGGGGGAGGNGFRAETTTENGTVGHGGDGGPGMLSNITGISNAYGGGGGGGSGGRIASFMRMGGDGGLGGGGTGGTNITNETGAPGGGANVLPMDGAQNTGGGGGGARFSTGGTGGSGIVIIRYKLPAKITASKQVSIYDPFGEGLYGLPGNDVIYTISATNTGSGQSDADTIEIIDKLPIEVSFFNGDINEGAPVTGPILFVDNGSGLTFSPATDAAYSDSTIRPSNFAACNYIPSSGYDENVTHICLNPKGQMNFGNPDPEFFFSFRAQLK